jgi:hypothetical protein
MKPGSILVLTAALAAGSAFAQATYSPEEFAVVRSGEKVSFDPQSVRTLGELTRYEIMISARPDAAGPFARRQVRYVARCAAGEFALASVALIDSNGRMLKNMVMPPGAGEYRKPAEGTGEGEWLAKACR